MKTKSLLAGIAGAVLATSLAAPANAGIGGSLSKLDSAIRSGGADAIISEVERAEKLVCGECPNVVMPLIHHSDYSVREVAGWWFAKRPFYKNMLSEEAALDLAGTDTVLARDAADLLGSFHDPAALPTLIAAMGNTAVGPEARAHIVRAIGFIGHFAGNAALGIALGDSDAGVRHAALQAYVLIRQQVPTAGVRGLIADSNVGVRRQAAAVVGQLRDADARVALESALGDTSPSVRRNAAWALGRIGDAASRDALVQASVDPSGLVRRTAKAALRLLK